VLNSPYTGSPIVLYIGPEQEQYHVPQGLLQNHQWIASLSPWNQAVQLPDVAKATGHTLVHYLYTGTYQTLDDVEASPKEQTRIEFRRAISAYTVGETHNLHGLQQLARQEIGRLDAGMDIFDIVEASKDEYSKLPTNTFWFHDLLNEKMKTAFDEDHTVFVKDGFFNSIDDITLTRVLIRRLMELYNDKISGLEPAAQEKHNDPEVVAEKLATKDAEEPVATEEPATEEAPIGEAPNEEPPTEEAPIEEALTEEPLPRNPPTTRKTIDFNFNFDHFVAAPIEAVTPPAEPAPDDDGWGFSFGTQKTSLAKKGTKKGRKSVVIEKDLSPPAEPQPEAYFKSEPELAPPAEEEQIKEDDWGFALLSPSKKKGKKGKKSAFVEPEPEPYPEQPEPEPVSDLYPEPEPEPVKEEYMH
jgi:hypothetical protein